VNPPFRILFVCTGNICRSPAGALLLQAALRPRPESSGQVLVASVGTHAVVGWPVDPPTVAALRARHIDPAGHRARLLTATAVAEADLVLGATRAHRAAVVSMFPKAVHYAYTIKEFARLAETVASSRYVAPGPRGLLSDVGSIRRSVRAAVPTDDDIDDPYGGTATDHEVTVAAIAAATAVVAAALNG